MKKKPSEQQIDPGKQVAELAGSLAKYVDGYEPLKCMRSKIKEKLAQEVMGEGRD